MTRSSLAEILDIDTAPRPAEATAERTYGAVLEIYEQRVPKKVDDTETVHVFAVYIRPEEQRIKPFLIGPQREPISYTLETTVEELKEIVERVFESNGLHTMNKHLKYSKRNLDELGVHQYIFLYKHKEKVRKALDPLN